MIKHEQESHTRFDLVDDPRAKSGKTVRVTTPSKVVNIPNREELLQQLAHYSNPLLRQVVPDTQFARRNYVEYVRPALRYYCKKFGVDVPGYLKDDGRYKDMADDQKRDLFGTTKLNIREFTPTKRPANEQAPQ